MQNTDGVYFFTFLLTMGEMWPTSCCPTNVALSFSIYILWSLVLQNSTLPLISGESHELHPSTENQPAIVVHVCEEPNGLRLIEKAKIQQTKRPEMN
jgi:hypothetical protein